MRLPLNPTCPMIIHYMGDESTAQVFAHGNSKRQTRLYIRTKPSVMEDMKARVSVQGASKVYKELVADPNVAGHDATSKPRNPKQVLNMKENVKQSERTSR